MVAVRVGGGVLVGVAVNAGVGVSVSDHWTVTVGKLQARIIPIMNRLIRTNGKRVFFIMFLPSPASIVHYKGVEQLRFPTCNSQKKQPQHVVCQGWKQIKFTGKFYVAPL
jgi:hypothetical protein